MNVDFVKIRDSSNYSALTKYIYVFEHHDIYNQKEADTIATKIITF